MAPISRDDHEERLARVEQMLEDLRREFSRLTEDQRRVRRDAVVTREETTEARDALRREIAISRRRRRVPSKKG